MPGTVPVSSVQEFYNDGKIFITGATGFVGKALVEKLLRVCPKVKHIYLLIRTKKGKDPQSRLKEIFSDPLFQVLKKERPDFEKKVTCIPGDVAAVRLNISDNDYEFLVNEVTHVFHSAATVRFNEKLKSAVGINVLGAQEIMDFCKKCVHLKVFVHISTAYANCVRDVVAEEYYDPPMSGDKILNLVNTLSEEKINSITEELIKPWPNTYSYTKAIAESIIRENGKTIPTIVFRPGIVMGSFREPLEGWIDNIYGPTGIITAVGVGLMRVLLADEASLANIIPVDLTVNAILSCAWEGATEFNNNNNNSGVENSLTESSESTELGRTALAPPKVYNFVVDENHAINWGDFLRINLSHGKNVPSMQAIWYYTLTLTRISIMYKILALLFHFIPAALGDGICVLLGKKPQLWKAYQKIYQFTILMAVFATARWKFTNHNVKSLYSRLSEADKELFDFDLSDIDWSVYLSKVVMGIRRYILQEKDQTLPAARRKMLLLWIAHRLLQFSFAILSLWILSKFLFTYDDLKAHFKEPILTHSGLLRNST